MTKAPSYEDWKRFFLRDKESPQGTRYCELGTSIRSDYNKFEFELQKNHPEAVAMFARYITWKLTS